MAESFAVPLEKATEPFVLSVDVGSTGTRGGIFDAAGRPVAKTRIKADHAFRADASGRSVINPDQIVHEVAAVLDVVARRELAGRIAAVALDAFATSLVGVDEYGAAVGPCYTYADTRCVPQVEELRAVLEEGALQQRTGTRLHSFYQPARLCWIRRTDPDTFDIVRTWMSIGEYVQLQLLGARGAALPTAAWSGLLNRHTADWDDETLAAIGVGRERLAPVRGPHDPFTEIPHRVTKRWPALAGAAWFPAIPDGFASNLGPGAISGRLMTLSASASGAVRVMVPGVPAHVPSGLWCYRIDDGRSLVGGALNDVGHMVTWLDGFIAAPLKGTRDDWLAGPPAPDTPVVLPFLNGERSTGWRGDARAVAAEMSARTGAAAFFRGAMEGVAFTYRRVVEQLDDVAPGVQGVVAAGGITQTLPHWLSIMANVLHREMVPVPQKRTTLRGTALLALDVVAPDVPRAEPEVNEQIIPTPAWEAEYDRRYRRFLELYEDNFG